MINISRLYCGKTSESFELRYRRARRGGRRAAGLRPVVVWNVTRTGNLQGPSGPGDSDSKRNPHELTTREALVMLHDLANFQIPTLVLSGGEPLARKDLFPLVRFGRSLRLRQTLSTNGTLITPGVAEKIRASGIASVSIGLDGMGSVNDKAHGVAGAFRQAVQGFRNCLAVGQRVGIRLALTRDTVKDLDGVFDLLEAERIPRACFRHLVPSGRGRGIASEALSPAEIRAAMDRILARTADFVRRWVPTEILTVGNHVDGVYLYLKLRREDPVRAEVTRRFLLWNGGGLHGSGVGIGCVDSPGTVHPDPFWNHYTLGNVRERPFSEIWLDTTDPIMAGLKDRPRRVGGRCQTCKWFDLCGGSLRVRAELATGDPWASDPACYLRDDETRS